jgi:hypothetical protein
MPDFPQVLLLSVPWSFVEPVPESPAALIEAVRAYAEDIQAEDPEWELARVLPFTDVRLKYGYAFEFADGDWRDREAEVRVVASALGQLTGADLLWELHVSWAATVPEEDHHYFEGLELDDWGDVGKPPVYRVLLGS